MSDARNVGRVFEDQAADFLLSQGYTLLTRRYHCRFGELDLVALEGDTLVFVEVKGSRSEAIRPEENLTERKRERLMRAAERFVAEFDVRDKPMRFDAIAIDGDGLRHYRNAFELCE